jgi:phage-related tail fiber protein
MTDFKTLTTHTGDAEFAQALANNSTVPFTHIALGDGNGSAVIPLKAANALTHEVHRALINSIVQHPQNANWVIVEATVPGTIGGWYVRELGLIGGSGGGNKLLAIGNFPDTYKPVLSEENASRDMNIRMVVAVGDAAVVNLTVDPGVVVATQQSVTTAIGNAMTEHGEAVNPHPQYTTADEVTNIVTQQANSGDLKKLVRRRIHSYL